MVRVKVVDSHLLHHVRMTYLRVPRGDGSGREQAEAHSSGARRPGMMSGRPEESKTDSWRPQNARKGRRRRIGGVEDDGVGFDPVMLLYHGSEDPHEPDNRDSRKWVDKRLF